VNDDWWINIHSTFTNRQGKRFVGGQAFRDLEQAARHIAWKLTNDPVDVYVCMSAQHAAKAKTDRKGRPYWGAVRSNANVACLRSIWIDVDVKAGGFATTEDALKAFGEFRRKAGLPLPTFVVMSGSGGFHVHWVLEEPLDLTEWSRLAHALVNAIKLLKFSPVDTGVSIDSARLLRVPDTVNCKTNPVKPVWLAHTGLVHSRRALEDPLAAYAAPPAHVLRAAATPPRLPGQSILGPNFEARAPIPFDPKEFSIFTPPAATVDEVAAACPFIRDTLATGGKDQPEPVWREALKVAYYCDDGLATAYKLSSGHADYSPTATEEKYGLIERDHGTGKYGWPQCDTIWKMGAKQCSTCPHRAKGKSPLNFAVTQLQQAAPPQASPQPAPVTGAGKFVTPSFPLPPLYSYDADSYIYIDEPDPEDPNIVHKVKVFGYPIFDIWPQRSVQGTGADGLNFRTELSHQDFRDIQLLHTDFSDARKMTARASEQGLPIGDHWVRSFRRFMHSFLEELRAHKLAAVPSESYGWSDNAFVYARTRFNCNGNTPVVPPDQVVAQLYHPRGSLEIWKAAARLITEQDRPELDAIIAASFGAPLVFHTGHSGFVMSAFSPETGIGKSTAMRVSQAVWSEPTSTMAGLDDTANYVNTRLGLLRHLPFLYDELKLEEQTQKFVNTVLAMGQGKTKGRLSRSSVSQKISSFATMMIAASNNSMVDYITEHTKLTTAGMYRVFEFRVRRNDAGTGMISGAHAQALIGSLDLNYGEPGRIYAEYLGQHYDDVRKKVVETNDKIMSMLGARQDERFWIATMTVVLLGAGYANQLGLTKINVEALSNFLVHEFRKMRLKGTASPNDITKSGSIATMVGDYVNARRQQTVITDKIWTQPTRPPQGWQVRTFSNPQRIQGQISVHAAKDDLLLRISVADFSTWLKDKRSVSKGVVLDQVLSTLPAKRVQSVLGLHTEYRQARETLIEFDLSQMPDFFNFN
jgi:hypothetical protein